MPGLEMIAAAMPCRSILEGFVIDSAHPRHWRANKTLPTARSSG